MAAMGDEAKFYAEEELVAAAPSRKNWRGMLIAIFVICVILGLIITAVILMSKDDDGLRVKGSRFTLDEVLGPQFQPRRFNGSWLSDNQLLTTDGNNNFQVLDAPSGIFRPLIYNESMVPIGTSYSLSADRRFLLLSSNYFKKPGQPIEFEASVYDLLTGVAYPVPYYSPDQPIRVQAALWHPKENALVYVRQNDIFYIADVTVDQSERLTTDGSFNEIYNGIPDWTYQDIMKNPALFFSEDGNRLCFITFNDTLVPEIQLKIYSEPDSFQLYTEHAIIRYPTPSSPIPRVSLRVIDLNEKTIIKELRPPLSLRDQEYYLTSVQWVNDQRVAAVWTHRAQNTTLVSFCDAGPWHCQTISATPIGLNIGSGSINDIDSHTHLYFHPDGNSFLQLAPVLMSDEVYFSNIIMVDALRRHSWPLTNLRSEIHRILGWDVKRNIVYFSGSPEGKPSRRHIYKFQIDAQKANQNDIECLTCFMFTRHLSEGISGSTQAPSNLSESIYSNGSMLTSSHPRHVHINSTCDFSNAILSPTLDFYIHECLGKCLPYVELRSLPTNKFVKVLQSNQKLQEELFQKAFPRILQFSVPLNQDSASWKRSKFDRASVQLYLPPGLREEENTVYPLVIYLADEPGAHAITDEWKANWPYYLSGRDVIVAQIDLQSSRNQRNLNYRLPGVPEAGDLVHITKVLQKTFPYISPIKTALIGAHYGGFLSVYTLANDVRSTFGCAVALSPVSSWQTLVAPYAERYLGLLNDKEAQRRYFEADLTTITKNLHSKYVFLLHGTLEEKYHVTHSMLLAKSMIENRFIFFQQQLYPDADFRAMQHNVQMYESIDSFLNDCFDRRRMPELDTTLHKGD